MENGRAGAKLLGLPPPTNAPDGPRPPSQPKVHTTQTQHSLIQPTSTRKNQHPPMPPKPTQLKATNQPEKPSTHQCRQSPASPNNQSTAAHHNSAGSAPHRKQLNRNSTNPTRSPYRKAHPEKPTSKRLKPTRRKPTSHHSSTPKHPLIF